MAIDAGRHPILESLHNDFVVCYYCIFSVYIIYLFNETYYSYCHILRVDADSVIFPMQPNNLFLSEASNMVIVMGPNM